MQNTTYYNLKKPEGTDFYNIENENDNMDIIDAELKEHDDAISELNTKIRVMPVSMAFYMHSVNAGGNIAIPLEPYVRATIFVASADANLRGIIGAYCNGSGSASASKIAGASSVGLSTASDKVTLTNNSSSSLYATVMYQ